MIKEKQKNKEGIDKARIITFFLLIGLSLGMVAGQGIWHQLNQIVDSTGTSLDLHPQNNIIDLAEQTNTIAKCVLLFDQGMPNTWTYDNTNAYWELAVNVPKRCMNGQKCTVVGIDYTTAPALPNYYAETYLQLKTGVSGVINPNLPGARINYPADAWITEQSGGWNMVRSTGDINGDTIPKRITGLLYSNYGGSNYRYELYDDSRSTGIENNNNQWTIRSGGTANPNSGTTQPRFQLWVC